VIPLEALTVPETPEADLILFNGRITTLDPADPQAQAVAMKDGKVLLAGTDVEAMALTGTRTKTVDIGRRRVIPGLIDSHTHVIRGGLNYNLELRWDGVPSLSDGMAMLRRQAQAYRAGKGRVAGGQIRKFVKRRALARRPKACGSRPRAAGTAVRSEQSTRSATAPQPQRRTSTRCSLG
jgi:predicted amidohydrolase YtcJ